MRLREKNPVHDFDIQLPRNLLRYQRHVTLPPPPITPTLVFSQTVALRSIAEAPRPSRSHSPEGCCGRLGGDSDAIGVAPPVNQPEVPLEATRHTPCIVPGIPEGTLVVPSSSQQISDPLVRQRPADTEQRSFRSCVRLFPTLLTAVRSLASLVKAQALTPPGARDCIIPLLPSPSPPPSTHPPEIDSVYSGSSRSRDRVLSRPDPDPIDRSIMKTLGPDFRRPRRSSFFAMSMT